MIAWVGALASRFGFGKKKKAKVTGRTIAMLYDAVQRSQENEKLWAGADWLSAKSANDPGTRIIARTRSRYEVANNSYARGITLTLANDLIGRGPRLQIRTDAEHAKSNRDVQRKFAQWAKAINLADKLRLMKLAKVSDGETFALIVNNPRVNSQVKLDICVIEADQVTTPTLAPWVNNAQKVDGIDLDKFGDPVAYHVLKQHPGDTFVSNLNPLACDTWDASLVLHWFRKDRPGQVRGMPELLAGLPLFGKMRRFTLAVLEAAEIAADFSAVLEQDIGASDDEEAGTPFDSLEIDRGLMTELPAGKRLKQFEAQQPQTTYEMFVRMLLREISRCLHVPFNIAAGDSSGYNYSSSRMDHLLYNRAQRIERVGCESAVLDRIFSMWLAEARLIDGYLPGDFELEETTGSANPTERQYTVPHRWFWDGSESIDPQKDENAFQTALANNSETLEAIWAEKGEDWEEAIEQRGREIAKCKAEGVPVSQQTPKPTPVPDDAEDPARTNKQFAEAA